MRKTRRKIKRRRKGKSKSKHRKSPLQRHFSAQISNSWTKITTYILIVLESVFVLWFLMDLFLNWEEIIMKLKGLISIGG